MKHLARVFATTFLLLCCQIAFSQTLYNPKNVDRTATSFFDGQQTFRALEYTVTADPQSQKVYRLQTLPENGFPVINLQGSDNGTTVFFEDKAPYDDMFTDNTTPYLSAEAVQLHYGFQKVMKVFDQRFGWRGMDGTGSVPIKIFMENSDGTPQNYSYAYYSANMNDRYFAFGKSIQNATPIYGSIDIIAHELSHAIMQHRNNIAYVTSICSEYRAVDEGLANVFGVYIKNKILQSTPQNYNWLSAESVVSTPHDLSAPKTYKSPDTYKGQYYVNVCSQYYDVNSASGIAGKWFYLLSTGFAGSATNDLGYQYSNLSGIGVEKAIQIIWDAVPNMKNYTDYPGLRTLTLKAAEQLYGLNSTEYQAVQKAWCAVGVCDNNLLVFSLSPANATSNIEPWPGVKINFSWDNDNRIKEWEVQTSTKYDFSENLQTMKVSTFDALFKPGGGVVYVGAATGYFHPEETGYVRVKITQADVDFCRGFNPLCQLFQQFSPTHAFVLDDKKAQFWHAVPGAGFIVNAWKDPAVSWKSVPNAEKYTYQVAIDKDFTNLIYTGTVDHTGSATESGIINAVLETNKYYYTRVRAQRNNTVKVINNFGAWSKIDSLAAYIPPTSVLQALNQKPNDPPTVVSSLGFGVDYYQSPGAFQYLLQVATDEAFSNIIRSQVAPGNVTNALVTLPNLADQTDMFVRVLPQKGIAYAKCTNVWRVKTDKDATLLAMAGPDPKIPIPFKTYLGKKFVWLYGTVNPDLVAHFKLCIKEKGSGQVTCFTTPGKALEKEILDQLMFDDHQGIEASVLAVGPQGAESALSPAFSYAICPDQPFPKFPGDQSTIDPALPVTITWDPSLWIEPGDQYLVTVLSNGIPINGFNNAPTTETFMVIPAGTLGNGKNYTYTVKNSGSCQGIDPYVVLFSTIAGGNNNPPAAPLKDIDIKVVGYRNDLDPADPFPIETSDYLLGVELRDPDGKIVQIVDANGNPVTEFWVDSENAILGLFKKDMPAGKYTLKVTMLNVVEPLFYNIFDQPHFSVLLNGKTVIDNHIITLNIDPVSNEWQDNFSFSDIILDHK
jgi:hypothetical protein